MITISPGHYGPKTGAHGIIDEGTENINVAKRVTAILRAANIQTNYIEDNVNKAQSANIGWLIAQHNKTSRSIDVSIHFNSSAGTHSKGIGTETLIYDAKHTVTAKAINDAICSAVGFKNRGVKIRPDLGLLKGTSKPCYLIEVCFVNDSVDVALYKRDFEKICQAIAKELATAVGKNFDKKSGSDKKVAFLSEITSGINDCWTKHQILPSVVLAQAILESGWGTSDKALKANNLFGIKANNDWSGPTVTLPTQEHVNGKWITIDAKWRKYNSLSECLVDHAAFLSKPRYKAIIGNTDYKSVCKELQKAGYATDPAYANKIMSVIETNKLTQFDQEAETLIFSSVALEQRVNSLLNDKSAQKEMIEKGIEAKAFNEGWREKFNKGELAKHDILGLSALYTAVK